MALRIDWGKMGPTLAGLAIFALAAVGVLLAPSLAAWIVEEFPFFSISAARALPPLLTGSAALSAAVLAARRGAARPRASLAQIT